MEFKDFSSEHATSGDMLTSKNVINLFEQKNWGLYEVNCPLYDMYCLDFVVSEGRERKFLKPDSKYIPLPLVKNDKITSEVYVAMDKMYRPPTYIEFAISDKYTEKDILNFHQKGIQIPIIARHPIDSIILNETLTFVIEKRLYEIVNKVNPHPWLANPCMEVCPHNIEKTINCVNRYRERKHGDPHMPLLTNMMIFD